MSEARLRIDQAGPLTTIQDRGRFGYQRYGVTEGGPMDRAAYLIGQAVVGHNPEGAAIEVGLGGITLQCAAGTVAVAVTGGNFTITIDGKDRRGWLVTTLNTGSKLEITPGRWGSWCYIAFAGSIRSPVWLGSRSTHPALTFTGRPLIRGDEITIESVSEIAVVERELTIPVFCQPRSTIGLVVGPQERFFAEGALGELFSASYFLSSSSDRMGVKLEGPKLQISASLDMLSEGVLRGSVQVAGGGSPVVLVADHQITGGYPKIATMISADQDAFIQLRPHQTVRFREVSVEQAVSRARMRKRVLHAYISLLTGERSAR